MTDWRAFLKDETPVCPECGEECTRFYTNDNGDVIGCDECITSVDAMDYLVKFMENEELCAEEQKREDAEFDA